MIRVPVAPSQLLAEPGVYMIRLLTDKRMYVGSSKNIRKRIQNHKSALKRGTHHSIHLQRAWDKHGADMFEFAALGYYPVEQLRQQEQFWLDEMTCAFNSSRTANSPVHTQEVKDRLRAAACAAWERPEYREKMSLRQLVPTRLGVKATEETKARLRESHRARNRTVQAFGRLWSVKELSEAYGVKYTMLKDRLRAGWEPERAVLQNKRKGGL